MKNSKELKDTPEGTLFKLVSINMAEQIKTQAMLETMISVMFSDEQKEQYNSKVKDLLKARMIKHVEAHPELSSDIQDVIEQIQNS